MDPVGIRQVEDVVHQLEEGRVQRVLIPGSVRPNFVSASVFWYFWSILMFWAKIRPAKVLEITKNQIFWPENLAKSIFCLVFW